MTKKIVCPECGGENIMDGKLCGRDYLVFVRKGTENKFRPDAYKTECRACADCGKVFDLRIVVKKAKE